MTTVSNIGPGAALLPLSGPVDDGPGSSDSGYFDRLLQQDSGDRYSDRSVTGPAADRPSRDDTPVSRPRDNAPASAPVNDSRANTPAGDTTASVDDFTGGNDKVAVGKEAGGSDGSAADKTQPDIAKADNSSIDAGSRTGLAGEVPLPAATPLPTAAATDIQIALQPQAAETPVPANAASTPIPGSPPLGSAADDAVPSGEATAGQATSDAVPGEQATAGQVTSGQNGKTFSAGSSVSESGNPVVPTLPVTKAQTAPVAGSSPADGNAASAAGKTSNPSQTAAATSNNVVPLDSPTSPVPVDEPAIAAPVSGEQVRVLTDGEAQGELPVLSEDEAQALVLISRPGAQPAGGKNKVKSAQATSPLIGALPSGPPAAVATPVIGVADTVSDAALNISTASGLPADSGIETAKSATATIAPTAGPAPAPVLPASFIPDPNVAVSADITPQSAPAAVSASTPHAQGLFPRMPVMTNIPLNQVAVQIARAFNEGTQKFSIRLHPAELGRVDVSLEVAKSGRVTAVLTADRQDTLDVLQRDARSLEQSLQDSGLSTDSGSLQFSLRDEGARQGFDAAFDSYRNSAGDDREAELMAIDNPLPGDRLVPSNRALDIRI